MKKTYMLSYYVLYALFAITIVVLGLFYFGGQAETPIVESTDAISQPAFTDTLLYQMYGMIGLTVALTILAFVKQFASAFKDSPKKALKSLTGGLFLAVVLIVSWAMGSTDALSIAGYEGVHNVPFWLKLTDMFIFTIYFLLCAAIVGIIAGSIKNRFH